MPFFVSKDGVKLHYETIGEGPPLVLQTGGAGDGSCGLTLDMSRIFL
jgi:hypothetical protein